MKKLLCGLLLATGALAAGFAVAGDELDVPVMMWSDGDLDTCSLGAVTGLDPNGDNFLAVRAGPGTGHRMLDKIHTDDEVWIFDENNGWFGVAYGSPNISCSPIRGNRPYDGPGSTGWVFGKYVKIIAG
ncbi:SH3 domain-containing protein [Hoeflea poritis]|uniref:SH3 domain-containing protein n=1 Tax=Hoeflea poritis TaxID=2993659 RepID=A0ABT4VHD4_9HYPH|nr:SH3 domain-containing protein [Hoeflea poritis]MDA4844124.1 SH3 domain-containing protein [Hoeflea poritis]